MKSASRRELIEAKKQLERENRDLALKLDDATKLYREMTRTAKKWYERFTMLGDDQILQYDIEPDRRGTLVQTAQVDAARINIGQNVHAWETREDIMNRMAVQLGRAMVNLGLVRFTFSEGEAYFPYESAGHVYARVDVLPWDQLVSRHGAVIMRRDNVRPVFSYDDDGMMNMRMEVGERDP